MQTNPSMSLQISPNNGLFELYKKITEKVQRTKLGHCNYIQIPFCIAKLICSLSPDAKGRCVRFFYLDGRIINQLEVCQFLDNNVYHIQTIVWDENIESLIQNSPNPYARDINDLERVKFAGCLDISVDQLGSFIEIIHYCYDKNHHLCWMNTNKMDCPKLNKKDAEEYKDDKMTKQQ